LLLLRHLVPRLGTRRSVTILLLGRRLGRWGRRDRSVVLIRRRAIRRLLLLVPSVLLLRLGLLSILRLTSIGLLSAMLLGRDRSLLIRRLGRLRRRLGRLRLDRRVSREVLILSPSLRGSRLLLAVKTWSGLRLLLGILTLTLLSIVGL
jgi:hypothetical protein